MCTRSSLLLLPLVLSLACTPAEGPAPAAPTSVENAELGVRVASVPDGFEVTENTGATLELAPTGEGAAGAVVVRVGPRETGVNLVAAVEDHREEIEGRTDGTYHGARELEGPLGVAFYSRGSYASQDGSRVEETLVTAIHPDGDRRLDLVYTYPAGDDSANRVTSLIDLLARVEGITPPAA
jgi:hypothetical protein